MDVKPASADDLKALRKNATGKRSVLRQLLGYVVWSVLQGTAGPRNDVPHVRPSGFDLVTVSINYPDERNWCAGRPAEGTRYQPQSAPGFDRYLCADGRFRFGLERCRPLPMLIRPDGEVVYKHQGEINPARVAAIDRCESRRR